MNNLHQFIFIMMIFCHIVDDFYLQGVLAKMKQKAWWQENAPDKLYKDDYIMALTVHGFSWAIMISLPLMIYVIVKDVSGGMSFILIAICVNMFIHGVVDDLKANKHKINLQVDQLIHFIQIWLTLILYNIIVGAIV